MASRYVRMQDQRLYRLRTLSKLRRGEWLKHHQREA
jgi:hypothetical protein